MKRLVSREYTLTEDEVREAILLFFKARDLPMPPADEPLSIRTSGVDLMEVEVAWSTRDEV